MKRLAGLFVLFCMLAPLGITAAGAELAEDITAACTVIADGVENGRLTDNSVYTYAEVKELEISSDKDIYGIYIKFDKECSPWVLKANGKVSAKGLDGFLHQYVGIDGAKNISISFAEDTLVADIFVFGQGELPDFVQVWEKAENADIMVCPTHSDDDQLYFAGMIPWCVANGYKVQVVYLTNHLDTHDRPHELLDGLWHCGLKYYPHVSPFPDIYSESFEQAKQLYETRGYEYEKFVDYYATLLQKYKPLVVAGHDANGEYGHGMHILSFNALTDAVKFSAESGLWDVPKTYIHLWAENSVVFDWDEPLEYFNGRSAFNVSQEGFGFHLSQHRFTGLTSWIFGTDYAPISLASQIRSLSPCRFGLYRSTVGMDTVSNGIFENLDEYFKEESSVESSTEESFESEESDSLSESDYEESEETSIIVEETTNELTSEEETEASNMQIVVEKSEQNTENKRDMFPLLLLGAAAVCLGIHIIVKRNSKD
ncbi:MAG: PIG-L family deacetylase [Clostridia bacterium]|nr:PIG-L family deacetylase [Clostridia bacterium]